jgi:hypothetical protein
MTGLLVAAEGSPHVAGSASVRAPGASMPAIGADVKGSGPTSLGGLAVFGLGPSICGVAPAFLPSRTTDHHRPRPATTVAHRAEEPLR